MSADHNNAPNLTPVMFVPLVLAIAVAVIYSFIPFVTQPELGATTIPTLTAERDNNEIDVVTNGIALIAIAAGTGILVGLWNLFNRNVTRAVSAIVALTGALILQYYLIFAIEYTEEGFTYLDAMGPAFWLLLGLGVLMILQIALPRPQVAREFQLRSLISNQESVILLALVTLVIVVGLANPRFVATRNILDVLQGNAYIAVAAIGASMVIITGNIDISVGSLIGLLAMISGRLVVAGAPAWVAWLVPLFAGAAVGAFIGFLVTYMRVPSIVVTLGMLSILKGGLIIWTNGQRVSNMPEAFYLAQMRPFGIPVPVIFMIVLTILAAIWMRYSATGRAFYAVGGNAESARLSGISQRRIVMTVFIINGVFAGIASVLYATQLRVIQATPPPALELVVITAAVVGGVSILGGTGTVIGATLAAILLNSLRSSMIFINVSPFWIQAVQGVLILITVLVDLIRRRRQSTE